MTLEVRASFGGNKAGRLKKTVRVKIYARPIYNI